MDDKIGSSILSGLGAVYAIGYMLSFMFFSWEYAQLNGFVSWLFFGEFVPALQAAVWPAYLLGALGVF